MSEVPHINSIIMSRRFPPTTSDSRFRGNDSWSVVASPEHSRGVKQSRGLVHRPKGLLLVLRPLAMTVGGLLAFFLLPSTAHAASLYWVGAAGASIATATNWLTTNPTACGGGDAGAAPGSVDTAIFDADCDNSAAVDASWTVQGININSGYTGTVTQSASTTVTIGTANYTQADGTFTDAANATSTIDINNGTFSLSGGTFSNTGATSNFTFDRNFTVSGGTFTNTSNTITFDGAEAADDSTITCTGTLSGTVAITMASSNNSTFTVASGCTISLGASPTTTFANNSVSSNLTR